MSRIIITSCLALLLMTGCGANYSCKETIDGVRCANIHSVYQEKVLGATGAKDPMSTVYAEKIPKKRDPKGIQNMATTVSLETAIIRQMGNDESRPIRVPTTVMRIWMAPWEDQDGDLHNPGYVYCEISGKRGRWLFGEQNVEGTTGHNVAYRRQINTQSPGASVSFANDKQTGKPCSGTFCEKTKSKPVVGKPPIPGDNSKESILRLSK